MLGRRLTSGEPEGKPELDDLLEVDLVARAVQGFAVDELDGSAWRGVVPAGGRALDHEPVHTGRLAGEADRQGGRGDDREEHRPSERRTRLRQDAPRIEVQDALAAVDVQRQRHGLVFGEAIQEPWDIAWDPGADQYDVDAREHGPVEGGRGRHLDLLQEVDPDEPVVALLREPHLDESGHRRELEALAVRLGREHRDRLERTSLVDAAVHEVLGEDPFGDRGLGERRHGAADVTVGVTHLQPAGKDHVDRGTGDHAELTRPRDRARELPAGHGHTHASLDDRWAQGHGLSDADGRAPGLDGPTRVEVSPDAMTICATAAVAITTNSTMIMMKVGRRTS